MFGFSMGEMFLLMAIALIAIGPKQLPEVARTLGKFLNELKRATGDFTRSFDDVAKDTRHSWDEARREMNQAFTAGSANYSSTVRPPPEGTAPTPPPPVYEDPGFDPHNPGNSSLHHDSGYEQQGSLFVPTDLSNVKPESEDVVEEQLAFKMTSFDDEGEKS